MDAEQAFEECLSRGGHWLQSAQINFMDKLVALARVIHFIGYRDGLAAFRPPLDIVMHVIGGRVCVWSVIDTRHGRAYSLC